MPSVIKTIDIVSFLQEALGSAGGLRPGVADTRLRDHQGIDFFGQALHIDEDRTASLGEVLPGMECRAYAEDGSLAGIIRYNEEGGLWRARKVFAPCA